VTPSPAAWPRAPRGTWETGYLKHLDPELQAYLTEGLNSIRKRVEAGELGPAFLRELNPTHSFLFPPEKTSGGINGGPSPPTAGRSGDIAN